MQADDWTAASSVSWLAPNAEDAIRPIGNYLADKKLMLQHVFDSVPHSQLQAILPPILKVRHAPNPKKSKRAFHIYSHIIAIHNLINNV